ncbi:MAG: hypothetical protein GEU90_17030 [Gemmatimonas sp.]|nr:hypothetical protein [Gemmatimonas sp.]
MMDDGFAMVSMLAMLICSYAFPPAPREAWEPYFEASISPSTRAAIRSRDGEGVDRGTSGSCGSDQIGGDWAHGERRGGREDTNSQPL